VGNELVNENFNKFSENFEEQFFLAPKLAHLFANDKDFAYAIGLGDRTPSERALPLQVRIGFILAMHRKMKSIFQCEPDLNLDDKFVMLINSRISLIPEVTQKYPDTNEYAKQCYVEANQNAQKFGMKWDDMSLRDKFFEVCLQTEMVAIDPFFPFSGSEIMKMAHRNTFTLLFEKTFEYVEWELDHRSDRTKRTKGNVEVEQLVKLNTKLQGEILEHPFFQDWVEAVQSYSGKMLEDEELEKTRQVFCSLFPEQILKNRWDGWQLGIPRSKDVMPEKAFNFYYGEATIFLRNFFKRVENDKIYCEWSDVINRFGEENVAIRMKGKTGLHCSLERVYWTFNIKFNNWIRKNKEKYDCSLVCQLDEIVARADEILREAFFPTPGPFEIGHKRRKEYQHKVLREFAPNLEKPLIEQIWPEDFQLKKKKLHKFSLAIVVVVSVLIGVLTVGYLIMKYSEVRAAGEDHKKAIGLYMESLAKATVDKDAKSKEEEVNAKKMLDKYEGRLKEFEGFWIRYENGWWCILSKRSFFTICVLSGFGATVISFFAMRFLFALAQMKKLSFLE